MKESYKIAFIYVNGHPNTVLLADFLGVNIRYKLTNFYSGSFRNVIKGLRDIWNLPRDSDIYLVEGNFITVLIAKKLNLIKKDALIIKYLGEPIFYRLLNGEISGFKKFFLTYFLRQLDGFICHGDWQAKLLSKYLPNAEKMVVYTPILPRTYKKLKNAKLPKLNSHNLLTIGNDRVKYKGLDISIEAFKMIKKKYKDAELIVIGKHDKKFIERYKEVDGLRFMGFVPSILPFIGNSSLYIHPSRGEAFGLSITEAMLGGLPAIVSKDTGAKTIVKDLGKRFIVKTGNSYDLYKQIDWYFQQNYKKKIALSKKSRRIAQRINPGIILPKFKIDFYKFIKSLK